MSAAETQRQAIVSSGGAPTSPGAQTAGECVHAHVSCLFGSQTDTQVQMPRAVQVRSPAAARDTIRVKVVVAGDPRSPARWLLVDRSQCRTIGDVQARLRALHPEAVTAGGRGERTLMLSLDGALLSAQEDAAILRDGETVIVTTGLLCW